MNQSFISAASLCTLVFSCIVRDSRVAQWKRAGPITQRSEDRNLALLIFFYIFYSCFSFNISDFFYSPFWNKSQGVRRFVKWKLHQTCPSYLDNHTNKCQNPISNRKRFSCPRVNFPALNTNRLIFRLADKITGRAAIFYSWSRKYKAPEVSDSTSAYETKPYDELPRPPEALL